MLLNVVKVARNYDKIKTVNNIIHPTFQSACNILGLSRDGREWHEALNEVFFWTTAFELR